jgi:peptidyl-prolyl cis-trans isomerase SurA
MAKMKLIHPLSLLLFLWGMAGVGVCQNTMNNGVAAVVNSEAITYQEVLSQTRMEEEDLRAQQQAGKITDDERKQRVKSRRKTVLDSLIETRLIIQDYKKKGYNFPDYYFDREEKSQLRDRFGGDRQVLVKTLEEQGKTMADWKKYIRDTFIVQQMRQINQRRFITISPHMIEEYYQENVRDFLTFERVKLRMIYLSPESGPEVEALGKEVLGQLESGVDFTQLARKYSEYNRAGGGLFQENGGWVERSGLKSELAEVAFKLRPGQASGLLSLPTAQGTSAYYILIVEDVQKAKAIPIESARGGIENTLTAKESEKVQKEWIDRLKRDAYIERFL